MILIFINQTIVQIRCSGLVDDEDDDGKERMMTMIISMMTRPTTRNRRREDDAAFGSAIPAIEGLILSVHYRSPNLVFCVLREQVVKEKDL